MNKSFALKQSYKNEILSDADFKFVIDVITENSNIYFFYGKLDKDLFYLSDNMCKKFGFEDNYVYHFCEKWEQCIYSNQDREMFINSLKTMYKNQESSIDFRFRVCDVNNNVSWIHFFGGVQYNEDKSKPLKFTGYMSQQDDYLLVDPVTGFPMDTYLEEYLYELQCEEKEMIGIGIHFKHLAEINYKHGREFTNQLLRNICAQLNQILKEKLKFFRLDGPIILAALDMEQMNRLDDIIYMIKTIIKNSYQENNIVVSNATHIVALKYSFNPSMFIENLYSLLKKYKHSANPLYIDDSLKSASRLADDEFTLRSKQILQIHEDVISGMNNFRIMIQPIVDVQTEKIVGGETLLRWKYAGQDISPSVFVEILEKQNLIQTVGRWVFEQAIQMEKLISAIRPDFYLSINISMLQLKDDGFIEFIKDRMKTYGVCGESIVIEMTESLMDSNPKRVSHFVSECNQLKIHLALDDFGTGYSSLTKLFEYETKIIKIDRSLLLEMEVSEERKRFISSIIKTFKTMGRKIIVEGVETQAQKLLIEDTQCDCIQGYYYYRPLEKKNIRRIFYC